jgi:hypothetical protein
MFKNIRRVSKLLGLYQENRMFQNFQKTIANLFPLHLKNHTSAVTKFINKNVFSFSYFNYILEREKQD